MKSNANALFGNARYIKATEKAPSFSYNDPLPFFRKEIAIDESFSLAELIVQAPGFAKFYINGKLATEDIFISATSDYDKILWYHTYDVTHLLKQGSNVLGVIAGNGFFNESFGTGWDFDIAPWRDAPPIFALLAYRRKRDRRQRRNMEGFKRTIAYHLQPSEKR